MFGRASGKSKLLKTHDGACCFVVHVEYHLCVRAVTSELCP